MKIEIKAVDFKDISYELLLLADPSKDAIEEYLERGDCYGAFDAKKMIGVIILIKTRPFTFEIANLSVEEKYQRKGIGKKLINYVQEVAKKQRGRILEIGTGNSSIGQLALYQQLGFRIIGIERDYFKNNYSEKIRENNIDCLDMIRLSKEI